MITVACTSGPAAGILFRVLPVCYVFGSPRIILTKEVVVKMASWIRASAVVCALVLIAACGGGEDQVTPREAEFAAIEQQKAALEAKRQGQARSSPPPTS